MTDPANKTDNEPMAQHWNAIPPALRSPWARRGAFARRLARRARFAVGDFGPTTRRAIDILSSSSALVLLAPVFATAAIAIRATSEGNVFFSQERLGKNGRPFRLWKLRTMVTNADGLKTALATQQKEATSGVRFKLKKDPRITAVGRFLRKLSLDELPQIWNVLKGDMTLIGPRPPVWREVALYSPRAMRRLEVKPGLTCLWQIGGRSDLTFEQQVDLDIEYIDRVRPFQELLILAKTIPAVLTGRGAY